METVTDKIERWKLLAEQFFEDNQKVFIKNIDDDLFFCDIILIGDKKITVDCFGPKQRAGKREYINWLDISKFSEYGEDK